MSLRAVFDTNVIVSAALDLRDSPGAGGRPSLCVELALGGFVTPVASEELLAEYTEVLTRPRFHLPPRLLANFLAALRAQTTVATPARIPAGVVRDPKDTHVLAAAVGGQADFLVTGNARDFPRSYRGIRVVAPAEFLLAIVEEG